MSTEHLISKEGSFDLHEEEIWERQVRKRSSKWPSSCHYMWILHLAVAAVYTTIFALALNRIHSKSNIEPFLIPSPANEAIRYERKFINNDVNSTNSYKGEPRKELDDAWKDLFKYNNIRVTKEELDKMNRTSVQLSDGSGDYLAALDVYHHLHCVKMIREYLHPDRYDMGNTIVDVADHVDHCLDALRQELMCRAEVSFTTYEWLPDVSIPWAVLSYDHTCVNFEAIDKWAGSRSIDIFDPKYLVHPTLGTVYGSHHSDHKHEYDHKHENS